MNIEVMKEKDAPAPPKKQSTAATELISALEKVKKDEVLKLSPQNGKSIRGLKTGVGRITKSADLKVTTWESDGFLYVKRS